MKKSKRFALIVLSSLMLLLLLLAGCGSDKSGNTINEPEITADYLEDEYANQLINDGAETMLGTVEIQKDGDSYTAYITEKEVVPSSEYKEGYYIADTNISKELPLGMEARMTYDLNDEETVVSADEFIKYSSDNPDCIYTVYMMGNSVELILAADPDDIIDD